MMRYRPVVGWGRLPDTWSFVEATSVAVDGRDNVYVFNRGGHPVIVFDREGTFVRAWGTDAEGLIYVADRENHRVQIFDGRGQYLGQLNNLHRPCGLFADRRDGGHLYVGELGSDLAVNATVPNIGQRVSVLSMKGDLVGRIGGRFPP